MITLNHVAGILIFGFGILIFVVIKVGEDFPKTMKMLEEVINNLKEIHKELDEIRDTIQR